MADPTYLTRRDAAALCGCHLDTIRRYEARGALPNTRRRPDGTTEVAVADLVAAGLLDPLAASGDVGELAGRSRAERDLVALRQDMAVAEATMAGLNECLACKDEEIAFLRGLLSKAAV